MKHLDEILTMLKPTQGVIDLGTLNWIYQTDGAYPVFRVTLDAPLLTTGSAPIFTTAYTVYPTTITATYLKTNLLDKTIAYQSSSISNQLMLQDSRFNNVNDLKAYLSGKPLFYQRSTDASFIQPKEFKSIGGVPGKNLFNKLTVTQGNPWCISDYIPAKGDTKYTLGVLTPSSTAGVVCYDSNKTQIGNKLIYGSNIPSSGYKTITTHPGTKFIVIQVNYDKLDIFQVVEGEFSTAPAYEPYKVSDIWQRAVEESTSKIKMASFHNNRKAVNLFDGGERGDYSTTSGEKIANSNKYRSKNKIPVIAGKTYSNNIINIPSWVTFDKLNVYGYNAQGTFIWYKTVGSSADQHWAVGGTLTMPENTAYITISTFGTDVNTDERVAELNEKFIIVEGSTAPTSYYPYFSPTKVMPSAKVFGKTKRAITIDGKRYIVPDDIELVEYIESHGTEYIDTEYKPNPATTKCKTRFTPLETGFVFGARTAAQTTSPDNANAYCQSKTSIRQDWICISSMVDVIEDSIVDFEALNQTLIINGTTYTGTITKTNEYLTRNFIIFGVQTGSSRSLAASRNYGLSLWDNGTLVRAMYPAIKNNTPGMYDFVTGTFFTNAGTGSFTAGPKIPVELYGVGEKTANLLNRPDGTYTSGDRGSETVSNNITTVNVQFSSAWSIYKLSGNVDANSISASLTDMKNKSTDSVLFKSGHTYIVKLFDSTSDYYDLQIANTANNMTIQNGVAFTPDADFNTLWTRMNQDGSGDQTGNKTFKVMIIEGTTAPTAYEPYGYAVDVLLGQQGVIDLGTPTWTYTTLAGAKVFSVEIPNRKTGNAGSVGMWCASYTKVNSSSALANSDMTFYPGNFSDPTITTVYFRNDNFDNADDFKAAMSGKPLYYQRTDDPSYIPPEKHTVFLPNQLFGVGSYADTLDFQTGGKVSNVGVKVFDGTENWSAFLNGFYTALTGLKSMTTDRAGFCTHYAFSDITGTAPNGYFIYNASPTNGNISFRDDNIGTDVNDWKAYLAAQYAAGTPVVVIYPLATPVNTTISVTPIALTTKGSKTLENTNLVKALTQVTYLNKDKYTEYTTTGSITNGRIDSETIKSNETKVVDIQPNSGYGYPSTVTVTGATFTYNAASGQVTLSNPTDNVTISGTCPKIITSYTITGTVTNGSIPTGLTIDITKTVNVTITPRTGYQLPASVSVSGATSSYNASTGVITISNPTGNVSFYTSCPIITYTITGNITHGSIPSGQTINYGGSKNITLTPNSGYGVPETVTVTGATSSYDATTGVVSLTNPTGNITISATCPAMTPTDTGLCLTSQANGSTVKLTAIGTPAWTGMYSVDGGYEWSNYTIGDVITLNSGDSVYFRGDITANFAYGNCLKFVMTGTIRASGNINSMYVSENFDSLTTLTYEYCYCRLFESCSALTTAPEMPALTLSKGCYYYCYKSCTYLLVAPELPATTLAEDCYCQMFYSNIRLITPAPEIPALTVVKNACYHMYENCKAITTMTEMKATRYNYSACMAMYQGCIALTTLVALPAGTIIADSYAFDAMFYGCTALTQMLDISLVTNASSSGIGNSYTFAYMYKICSKLSISDYEDASHPNTFGFPNYIDYNYSYTEFLTNYYGSQNRLAYTNATVVSNNTVTKYTVSITVNNGTGPSYAQTIVPGKSKPIIITPNTGCEFPTASDISVTNCTLRTLSPAYNTINISNATGNVTMTVTCPAPSSYTITGNITNGSIVSGQTILPSETKEIAITPTSGHAFPLYVIVEGATYTYDYGRGVVTLSSPTGNVTIDATCDSAPALTCSVTNGTYTAPPAIGLYGANVSITPNSGKRLPYHVVMDGDTDGYAMSINDGSLDIYIYGSSNPVSITAECIAPSPANMHDIIFAIPHCTPSGPTYMANNTAAYARITITADAGYTVPDSIDNINTSGVRNIVSYTKSGNTQAVLTLQYAIDTVLIWLM